VANAADSLPVHTASEQAGITASGQAGIIAEGPSRKGGSVEPDDTIALQLRPTSRPTAQAPKEPLIRKMGPISPEEFHALASFLYENPWTYEKLGYTAHFEKFRQTVMNFHHYLPI
jgi:hypothetical protein